MIPLVMLLVILAAWGGVEMLESPVLLAGWVGLVIVLVAFGLSKIKPSDLLMCKNHLGLAVLLVIAWVVITWLINGQTQGGVIILSYGLAILGAIGVGRMYTEDDLHHAIYYAGWVFAVVWLLFGLDDSRNIDAIWFGLWFVAGVKLHKPWAAVVAVLLILITGSRSGIVVAAVGTLIIYPPTLRQLLVMAIVGVLLVGARLQTVSNRIGVWVDSLQVLGESGIITNLVGRGPGWVQMSGIVRDMGRLSPHAHNMVLQVVLEYGFIGMGLVSNAMIQWQKQYKPGLIYLAPLLVIGLFDWPWHTPGLVVLTGLLIGQREI